MKNEIKGYITNLGKYNEGCMMGEWVTFPITEDEQQELFERIGIDGKYYEEYFFADWESELSLNLGEFITIDEVNEQAEALEGADAEHIAAIIEAEGCNVTEALELVDDTIFYPEMELIDVAYQIVDECYELPEIAEMYFDYEAFARDLRYDGYTETSYGVIGR